MKSRKLRLFGNRKQNRDTAAKTKKSTLRRGLVETLERRELLAGDLVPYSDGLYYPEIGVHTGDLIGGLSTAEYMRRHEATSQGGSGSAAGSGEDATSGAATTVSESEPNNSHSTAQLLPLGAVGGQIPIVNIVGQITSSLTGPIGQSFDEDWFAADLRAGDIVDVLLEGTPGVNALPYEVTLMNSSRVEIAGRASPAFPVYPPTSPLAQGGSVSFAYVVPEDGRYYLRVLDGDSSYNMRAKVFRPTLEKEVVGTKQRVFVDFDGARVRRDRFGIPGGTARLSPITSFFAGANLQPADEERFIRSIMEKIEENFQGSLPSLANNGHFSADGIAGHFDIEFLNSFDHPDFDPVANSNVTQLIISGSLAEFGTPVRGISDSIDVGNFETAGTTIVLPDVYMSPTVLGAANADYVGLVPLAAGVPALEAYATAIAVTASHELGHSFGAFHQDNSNANLQLVDTGGLPVATSRLGVGPDGIFGTDDDIDLDFGVDFYDPTELNIGLNDTAAAMAFGLSTGTAGGSVVMGNVYTDVNLSRSFDSGDQAGPASRVYADANNNGVLDTGEFFSVPNAAGQYTLSLPAGAHNLRVESAVGYRMTTSPVITVDLPVNGSANVDFGFELIDSSITGIKWLDANADGVRDAGENGLEGVWIYIDLDGDNRIDLGEPSTQTDENGGYRLNFPGAGTYTIREVLAPGFQQTFPGPTADNEHTITLTGNPVTDADIVAGLNFGNSLTVDFGDAPATYGAAAHGLNSNLRLGIEWDAEAANQPSIDALGDDINGTSVPDDEKDGGTSVTDDEDGVTQLRAFQPGANAVSVTAQNGTGSSAFLNAWFDFNHDGDFLDSGEHVVQNQVLASGTQTVSFTAPDDLVTGTTFARFRYSTESGIGPFGIASDGEVEDYAFTFAAGGNGDEFGVNDTETVARNSTGNVFDVLANDLKLPGETLTLLSNSSSIAGATIAIVNGQIVYTPPTGFIGVDSFTYTVQNSLGETNTPNVTVNVQLSFDNPVAVDDSFDLASESIDFPLNVLANDIEGQNGALTIVSLTQPDGGGAVSIATGGKSLRYTPLRGFGSTESFTYTAQDAAGNRTTATVTLHTLPGDRLDDDVLIQLVARDVDGNLITAIPQGERFVIDVVIDDLRDTVEQGVFAGVFAAFADVLYDLQLVSTVPTQPGSRLNFEADFFNNYTNGTRGDASVPGIIDDFGAFLAGSTLNEPNPVKMASIEFEARAPGIVNFMPDPADTVPATDTLLFNLPNDPVPIKNIRYLGTMVEIVSDGSQFPVAVDDSVPVAFGQGSFNNPIDVLANDIAGSAGTISISSFQTPTNQGGNVRLNDAGNGLLYTPRTDFVGTDQFTYEIQDSRGIRSTATVTLRVGDADADDIVRLNLRATDANGNEIDEIVVGQTFQLRGFVQDLRTAGPNLGIFAAYEDILYSSDLVSVNASSTNDPNLGFEVSFGPDYNRVREGNIRTAGLINELGAVSTGDLPLGTEEKLLFTINLTANSIGLAQFIADPADISPLHDVLTYEPVEPVPFDKVTFGFDSLNIVETSGGAGGEGWHNDRMALDVNNDGHISPIDALGVINLLNSGSSGPLGGSGEGEDGDRLFIDTNDDGHLSPIDALLVINHLNWSGSAAEGEGADLLAALGAGSEAESASGVEGEFDAALSDESLTSDNAKKIGTRITNHVYGPQPLVSSSGNMEADETDDLFGQLGDGIDENPFI